MTGRPDQENLDSLLSHIRHNVGFGETTIKITAHAGWLASWEEIETKRGHKAALKKDIERLETD